MARTKILLIAAVRYAHEAYQQLEQDYEVIVRLSASHRLDMLTAFLRQVRRFTGSTKLFR